MTTLKYKVITSKAQYKEYSNILQELVFSGSKDRNTKDEIALLTLLIEKWDADHNSFDDIDPVHLLRSLMYDHKMKSKELVGLLDVSKGYVSDILNYKKGLSKDVIRKLANYFKVSQEAFNRPYKLVPESSRSRNTGSKLSRYARFEDLKSGGYSDKTSRVDYKKLLSEYEIFLSSLRNEYKNQTKSKPRNARKSK